MTSRAQMQLEEEFIQKILTFSALLCEQMLNKNERQTTKQKNQEHRNIAPLSLQLRSCKKTIKQEKIAGRPNLQFKEFPSQKKPRQKLRMVGKNSKKNEKSKKQ